MESGAIIKEKEGGESLKEIITRIEEKNPRLTSFKLTNAMRRGAAIQDAVDRKKLGDDY